MAAILLKLGDRGPQVLRLQLLLSARVAGLPLRANADFGPATREAIVAFQRARGLPPTGFVDPRMWAALGQRVWRWLPRVLATSGTNWLAIAEEELGIHEDSLPDQHNRRILEYHQTTGLKATTDETPWCSAFVNWVVIKAGYSGTRSAAAKSWLEWGHHLTEPRAGAVAVIKRVSASADAGFHVGFTVSCSTTALRLLGGNQSDQVKYSNFPLKSYEVKGYRWPR